MKAKSKPMSEANPSPLVSGEVGDDGRADSQRSLARQIIDIVRGEADLFHDQEKRGHVLVDWEGHRDIFRIGSEDFSHYLAHVAWRHFGEALSSYAQEKITGTLESIARFEGEKRMLYLRTAWDQGILWYDLGDWKAVKITTSGWEVVENPPILFRRFAHGKVQVDPVEGGELRNLLQYLNIDPKKQRGMEILLLTYLVAVLIPDVPRPILAPHGLPGSAKSTYSRVIKSLIDPSLLEVMTYPSQSQELIQMLAHHYLICFDNLSDLSERQSDELCRACTGQAFSKRALYSDDNDVIYCYKRALLINGVSLVATKSDLLDRSLIFELEPIPPNKRIDEETIMKRFEEEKPKLLGAIFSALSKAMALREQGVIELKMKPRLADYALWASAAAMALGYSVNDFIGAYQENVELQNAEALEASPIAQTVIEYMRGKKDSRMSAAALFPILQKVAEGLGLGKTSSFPKDSNWLWRKIKEVKANLLSIGIIVDYDKRARPREITMENLNFESVDLADFGDGTWPPK